MASRAAVCSSGAAWICPAGGAMPAAGGRTIRGQSESTRTRTNAGGLHRAAPAVNLAQSRMAKTLAARHERADTGPGRPRGDVLARRLTPRPPVSGAVNGQVWPPRMNGARAATWMLAGRFRAGAGRPV